MFMIISYRYRQGLIKRRLEKASFLIRFVREGKGGEPS
jgi:hypothetical protein